jgi:putative ABC transport system ATP-binding protein
MQQGKTIVLITHEPNIAQHADRIIHIRDGSILTDEKNHKKLVARNEKDIS